MVSSSALLLIISASVVCLVLLGNSYCCNCILNPVLTES